MASKKPVQIPIGSTAEVKLQTPRKWILNQLRLELYQPPEGISLGDVKVRKNGLAVSLKADPHCLSDGFEDNLIIEAWREFIPEDKDGKPTGPQRRNWVGILPAIPIQIIPAAETDSSTKAALRSQL